MRFLVIVICVLDDRQANLIIVVIARNTDLVGAPVHPRHEVIALSAFALGQDVLH